MSERTKIRILENEPYGTISPRLYGHFAEHLGRCCYDGLWVGNHFTDVPHVDGFRKDVVDALRALPAPLMRWPGGCYADHYHWRDGLGDPMSRPVRLGLSCGLQVEDDNSLGTHEFLRLCEMIGAEPYLAGNMGSGSVQELCDWVEYCNSAVATNLAKERAANGHEAPYGVKLWGVGNENWGCGGCYEAESYGLEYRRYASMIKHVYPKAELVLCGHDADWNVRVTQAVRNHFGLMDHFSIHRYWIGGGPGVGFDETQYYASLVEAEATEEFIKATRQILDEYDPKRRVGIALDEWGVWHPEARGWGPDGIGDSSGEYFQAATLRDGVLTAIALEAFHRQCAGLSMANLAQAANVLHTPIQTLGPHMWLTPTYHVLRIFGHHIGRQAVRVELESCPSLPDGNPSVSATASQSEAGTVLSVTNRHYALGQAVVVPSWAGTFELVTGEDPRDQNSPADPDKISVERVSTRQDGGVRVLEIPPHSVATARSA